MKKPKKTRINSSYRPHGHFDNVSEDLATGWAINSNDIEKKAVIEIWADGRIVGLGKAELPRDDLSSLGLADVNHGFEIKLSSEIKNGSEYLLTAVNADTKQKLLGEAIAFSSYETAHKTGWMLRAECLSEITEALDAVSNIPQKSRKIILDAAELACLHQECENFSAALDTWIALDKALEKSSIVRFKLGEILYLSGEVESAAAAFRQSVSFNLKSSWAHWGLSICLEKQGKKAESKQEAHLASALSPQSILFSSTLSSFIPTAIPVIVDQIHANDGEDKAVLFLLDELRKFPANKTIQDTLLQIKNVEITTAPISQSIIENEKNSALISIILDNISAK